MFYSIVEARCPSDYSKMMVKLPRLVQISKRNALVGCHWRPAYALDWLSRSTALCMFAYLDDTNYQKLPLLSLHKRPKIKKGIICQICKFRSGSDEHFGRNIKLHVRVSFSSSFIETRRHINRGLDVCFQVKLTGEDPANESTPVIT